MTLGERILQVRKRLGIKQIDLARTCGVDKMTIWRLEHGEIEDVKGQLIAKLALALETPAGYLLGIEPERQLQLLDDPQPAPDTARPRTSRKKRPRSEVAHAGDAL